MSLPSMPSSGNSSTAASNRQRSDTVHMGTYRRLFGYVRPYHSWLLWSVLCGVLLSGTTALAALLVKPVLDQIFVDRDTTKLSWFPLVIVLLYIVRGLLYYGHSYLMRSIGQHVIRDMRDAFFAHVQ